MSENNDNISINKPINDNNHKKGNKKKNNNSFINKIKELIHFEKGKVVVKNNEIGNLNIALTVLVAIADVFILLMLYVLNGYSALSKTIFLIVNIVALILILGLNTSLFGFIKTRKSVLFVTIVCLLIVNLIVGIPGSGYALRVNKNVNKIVNNSTSETVERSLTTAIVTNGTSYTDLDNLDGKTVGIVTGTQYADLAKEQLEASEVNCSYKEFDSFSDLLMALISKDVDAGALPSNYKDMYKNETGISDYLDDLNSLYEFEKVVQQENTVASSDKDLTTEPFSVLILGNADGNTDAIILATFNPISMQLTMTSIARDSWVNLCGRGENKINAAYAYGGTSCIISTVESLLDVDIDYYFMANFQGIVDIVDAIGGIVVDNPYEFVGQSSSAQRGHYTVWVPAGEDVPLNGEQALAFARERHLYATGDFQRQVNQQTVINAILTKCLRIRDLNTMMSILDAAGENIETNISSDQLIDLFNYVIKKLNRWDYTEDHPEKIINIVGSRVTGYNSSIWNEAYQLALSIVRPYQGSISDNHDAIVRNLMQDKTYTAKKSMTWNSTFEYTAPTISNEAYSEQIIQSETPASYWCSVTGGTWDGSSCSCPDGSSFVEDRGCEVTTVDLSTYTDQNSCNVAGGLWVEDAYYCTSACPSGYTQAVSGVCSVATACSVNNPSACSSESACKEVYGEDGHWYNEQCNKATESSNSCSVSNLNNCKTESECKSINGNWNSTTSSCVICSSGTTYDATSGSCKATSTATPTVTPTAVPTTAPTPSATTEPTATPQPSSTPEPTEDTSCRADGLGYCGDQASCNGAGGVWYGSCIASCPEGTTNENGACVIIVAPEPVVTDTPSNTEPATQSTESTSALIDKLKEINLSRLKKIDFSKLLKISVS